MKFTVFSIFVFLSSASAIAAVPLLPPAPAMVAQASQAQDPARTDRTIGVCHLVNSRINGRDDSQSMVYVASPAQSISNFIMRSEHKFLDYTKDVKITVLQGVQHGELNEEGGIYYRYTPTFDYLGADQAIFLIEMGGHKFKAVYYFKVIDGGAIGGTEVVDKQNCPKGRAWKISLKLNDAISGVWA